MKRHRSDILGGRDRLSESGQLRGFPPTRKALIWTIVVLAIIHLAGVVPTWWPTPDSALHLSIARSLANGEGYQFNGQPHNIVPPGFPVMLAGLGPPDGIGQGFFVHNLLVVLCGLAALWLMYLAISRLSDRRSALAVVLVLGISYRFYQNSHRILSDMPATLAVWAMLYAALRYQTARWPWLAMAAVMAFAAMAIRIPSALAIGPIALGVILDRSVGEHRGRRWAGLVAMGTAVVSWCVWIVLGGRLAESTPGYSFVLRPEQHHAVYWLMQPVKACRNLIESMAEYLTGQELTWVIGLPAVVMMVIGMVAAWRAGRRFAPAVIVLYLVATVLATGEWAIRERYMLACIPIFLLMMFEGVGCVVTWVGRRRRIADRPQARLIVIGVLTALFMVANAPRTLRWGFYYSYLSYTPRYYESIAHGKYRELPAACEALGSGRRGEQPVALIGVNASLVHFSTNRIVETPVFDDGSPVPMATGEHAAVSLAYIRRPDGPRWLMVDVRGAQPAFGEALTMGLKEMIDAGELEPLYQGLDYQVYGPPGPPGD